MPKRYGNRQSRRVFRVSARRIGLLGLAVILSVTVMTLIRGCHREPPDIGDCTRLEVHFIRGAIRYYIYTAERYRIFNEDERRLVKSFDTLTVTDPQLIKAFAHDIGQGTYKGRDWLDMEAGDSDAELNVACYRGSEQTASFTVNRGTIIADRKIFEYSLFKPDIGIFEPPEVKPLQTRRRCAGELGELHYWGLHNRRARLFPDPNRPYEYEDAVEGMRHMYVGYCSPYSWGRHNKRDRLYPDPNRWCDDTVEYLRSLYVGYSSPYDKSKYWGSDTHISRMFVYHSRKVSTAASDIRAKAATQKGLVWRSDYAMNPHCRKGSPRNMVLLFESKLGWNQHGGPELFTFDNHDPKGGCVLLNDGTVKFIRTEEELHQLRWK